MSKLRYTSLIPHLIVSFLLAPSLAFSATLSDGFENTNVTTVASFDIVEDGITATFTGGTAFTIGDASLYHTGAKSWMIEPAGTNGRGTHPGTGTATFDTDIESISLWVIADSNQITVTVALLDGNDIAVENFTPFTTVSTTWQQVDFTLTTGSPAIRKVTVEVMGTGMLAIDDLIISTADSGGDTGGDSGGG
ncbi:MAG: hypothetical protein COA99_17520, partial [Moraxellaceae bacterium]